jgi:hypothetical protein
MANKYQTVKIVTVITDEGVTITILMIKDDE